jgi:hypothetical protein
LLIEKLKRQHKSVTAKRAETMYTGFDKNALDKTSNISAVTSAVMKEGLVDGETLVRCLHEYIFGDHALEHLD